jgi:hypothetical protein
MSIWFSPLGEAKHHVKITFVKKTKLKDINAKIKCFNHAFFTNCKHKWFFTTKNVRFSKNNLVHIIFLKGSLDTKNKKWMNLYICRFFIGCFSKHLFIAKLIHVQNFSNFLIVLHQHVFSCMLFHFL